MPTKTITENEIWDLMREIHDPEIPVINVVELGIVREVEIIDGNPKVTITPTYSGCPAMDVIQVDIEKALHDEGFDEAEVVTILHPPWTTDWMTEEAREKLRDFGIAPPEKGTADKGALFQKERKVQCPNCGSMNTELISPFGSTACKAQHRCKDCNDPFDYFKCL
jgi:ring-1,2-phenylacetyl-CoA epoxidase subunit PaaD